MPIDCVSVDTLPIQVATLITSIVGIGAMNAADVTFAIELNINMSKFLGFFVQYFGKLHLDILNEFL